MGDNRAEVNPEIHFNEMLIDSYRYFTPLPINLNNLILILMSTNFYKEKIQCLFSQFHFQFHMIEGSMSSQINKDFYL